MELTVTVHVAVLLPSAVVTVMVAVPVLTAVTKPPDTVATAVLPLLHVTFLFVALEGSILAKRVSVPPTARLVDAFKDTPVTAMGLTVTVQEAVLLPSAVVTVMVAVPTLTAVTKPPDTVATAVLLLLHVTFLFVALEGSILAKRVSAPPTARLVDAFKDTPVTAMGLTVTVQEAVLLPSAVVTVMIAVPALTAVTKPPDTVATAVLPLLHVTLLFVALEGSILAKRVSVLPMTRLVVVLFKDTPVTATLLVLTVTVQVA